MRFANVRVLWSFVRPHRRPLLVAFALTVVTTGTTLATPMATKGILDGLADSAPLARAIWILVGLLIVGSALGWIRLIMLGRIAEQVVLDARVTMVRRLLHVPVGGLGRRSPGELVTRVTSDTLLLREAASSTALEFFSSMIMVVGSLVLMAALDWVLLLVMVATIVLIGAVIGLVMRPLAAAQQEAQAAIGRLGGVLEGALRAIRTVKASRSETWESDRILSEARESFRQRMRAVRIEALSWTLTGVGFQGAILVILGLGAWRVSLGQLTVSGLVAFLLYAFLVVDPVTQLSQSVSLLQSGLAASARIREIQDLPVEDTTTVPERTTAPVAGIHSPVLSFSQVTARYAPGTRRALNGVSMDIPRRGHTAVVGPSGAGKTTLFSLVLRFLEPEDGAVALDGVPLAQYSLDELRRRIVYVEQDTPLVPGTLRENLRYTDPEADDEALWAVLRAVRLDEKVSSLPQGLDTPLDGTVVSGGERQRIALARALVSEPEILLLDEATAQLDGLTESAIHDAVVGIAARGAVITIAHRLSTVVDADQILVMEDGLCRATGSHDELLATDDLYRDLVAALRIATINQATQGRDTAVAG
ncbi:ABC transporter ATP-binding protein [Streptomyces virginiae]|uniref:ABC transporter ATP-binding protein n=1 Tax=Streptomyces virginiae TaxID=1961 RepID=UPI002DDBB364|nr:ABC transporter ATP-binding protein [Streptomyces virginiae]WSC81155.1 ABC transporter ATP-binding protein/permease [Streptomyces virginiae]